MPFTTDALFLSLGVFLCWATLFIRRKRSPNRPPGPRGLPVVGNMFDMPGTRSRLQSWKVFAEWGQQYGGIMSIRVLGQTIIILDDSQFATELLDKRGSSYSGRTNTQMMEMSKWNRSPSLGPWTNRTKGHRKLMAQAIGSHSAVKSYEWAANRATVLMLQNLFTDPDSLPQAVESATGSFLATLSYGYTPLVYDTDPLITKMQHMAYLFGEMLSPGRFTVDIVPALRYLVPSWLPYFGEFHHWAADTAKRQLDAAEIPFFEAEERIARGECRPSFVSNLLTSLPEASAEKRDLIMWTAWGLYAAGTETMKAAIMSFILAMTVYPEVQNKLQAEIDQIVGQDRLPTTADFASLPYLDAVCKEALRIFPGAPIGLPHEASEDDIFQGYFIPKGAAVIANIWKFCHDPEVYHRPSEFNPDRFLGEIPERDPSEFVFGFGRRICPGLYLTGLMVNLSIARLASTFTFSKARREDGSEIEPDWDQTSNSISQPLPFQCMIKLRHEHARELFEGEMANLA